MNTRAFIGLGSNLGDRAGMLDQAIGQLQLLELVTLEGVSSYWETEPVGPPQPKYLNAAAEVATALTAEELLEQLLALETRLGRVRTPCERSAPRTIDLDLLLFGESVIADSGLQVPHPRMLERGFVLVPLLEIDPALKHPGTGESLASALSARSGDGGVMGVALWRARSSQSRPGVPMETPRR